MQWIEQFMRKNANERRNMGYHKRNYSDADRIRNHNRYIRTRHKKGLYGAGYYCIITDPDPIAGFSAGAMITKEEHKNMLRFNCYTPGTILRGSGGKLWCVAQGAVMQRLVEYVEAG